MNAGEERQRRFREFEQGAFNIMKLALAWDVTPALAVQVKADIGRSITPEVREEMLCYTDKIEILVDGSQWYTRHGWFWRQRTLHKRITAEITFEPYRTSLSVWTDPKVIGGVVCFR